MRLTSGTEHDLATDCPGRSHFRRRMRTSLAHFRGPSAHARRALAGEKATARRGARLSVQVLFEPTAKVGECLREVPRPGVRRCACGRVPHNYGQTLRIVNPNQSESRLQTRETSLQTLGPAPDAHARYLASHVVRASRLSIGSASRPAEIARLRDWFSSLVNP